MTYQMSAHRFYAITGFLFHDFNVEDDIVGVTQKVPVFFANSKNIITSYTNIESNVCLALSAIIANNSINNPKKKFSEEMMKQAVKQLLMKKYGCNAASGPNGPYGDSFNIKTFKGEELDELQ